jgi:hypothetical protein
MHEYQFIIKTGNLAKNQMWNKFRLLDTLKIKIVTFHWTKIKYSKITQKLKSKSSLKSYTNAFIFRMRDGQLRIPLK